MALMSIEKRMLRRPSVLCPLLNKCATSSRATYVKIDAYYVLAKGSETLQTRQQLANQVASQIKEAADADVAKLLRQRELLLIQLVP